MRNEVGNFQPALLGKIQSALTVPTRMMVRASRAAAVKDGPLLGPPGGLVLEGREHDGRLAWVGIDRQRVMSALVIDR